MTHATDSKIVLYILLFVPPANTKMHLTGKTSILIETSYARFASVTLVPNEQNSWGQGCLIDLRAASSVRMGKLL